MFNEHPVPPYIPLLYVRLSVRHTGLFAGLLLKYIRGVMYY